MIRSIINKQFIESGLFTSKLRVMNFPLITHTNYFFSSSPASQQSFVLNPSIKHTAQINIRATRRRFLKQSVLNHNKIVLWAQRRKLSDRILPLKAQGKCVAIIKRHSSISSQQKQIDIVLSAKQIRGMRKNRNNGLMTVYVRVEDKEYRCILDEIIMHHEEWVEKVVFEEYVPYEANCLNVPVEITHITENPYFIQGSQFYIKTQRLNIICYNDQYPLKFYVDTSFVCPQRPYRVGDLANTFPPGVMLSSEVSPNQRIFEILPVPKMQLHMKQKLMKSYLASTKKEKVVGGGAPGGAAGGVAGSTPAGGATGGATGGAAKK